MDPARALPALAVAALTAVGLSAATLSVQQDLAAYRVAGAARQAGLDPYVNHAGAGEELADPVAIFRHSRFLYPPLVADLFCTLAAVPYRAAKLLFTVGLIAAWLAAGIAAGIVAPRGPGRTTFLVAGAAFFPLWRHLERGQIDLLLLLLLAIAWRARGRAVPWGAGLALAAAIAVKPGLAAVALVIAALGRWRVAAAAALGLAALAGLTALVDGPGRLREYLAEVAPRAALYGEGGTEAMLLPADRAPAGSDDETTTVEGHRYRIALWDGLPVAASLPRMLAPEGPTRAATVLPLLGLLALLVVGARRVARAGGDGAWLFWGAAVASVIASPAGWVMGLVFALPLAPRLATALGRRAWPRPLSIAAGASWLGMAAPWPWAGVAALAATAFVAVTALAAARGPAEAHL